MPRDNHVSARNRSRRWLLAVVALCLLLWVLVLWGPIPGIFR
jgi:hypothetical protein